MACPFCDAMVAPGSSYCAHCGTAVVSAAAYDPGYDPKAAAAGIADPYLDSPYARGGQNVRTYGPMAPGTSSLAIWSLSLGILTWVFPFLPAIIAIILGHMAKREIRESRGQLTGEGMATVGLVLSYVHLGIVVGCIVIFGLFILVAIGAAAM